VSVSVDYLVSTFFVSYRRIQCYLETEEAYDKIWKENTPQCTVAILPLFFRLIMTVAPVVVMMVNCRSLLSLVSRTLYPTCTVNSAMCEHID